MIDYVDNLFIEGFIAFARIAGCFLILPGFSSARVPIQVRIVFVIALTFSLFPFLVTNKKQLALDEPAILVQTVFWETFIGAILGFSARYYILAVSFIATAASSVIGFNTLVAPSIIEGELEPALATLMSFVSLLAIFAMDFHHQMIIALVDSYRLVPVGNRIAFDAATFDLVRILHDSFLIMFRLGSPFIIYALVANLFVALLNKLTPNIQLYFIATPAVLFGGLIVAYFVLPAYLSFVGQGLETIELFK